MASPTQEEKIQEQPPHQSGTLPAVISVDGPEEKGRSNATDETNTSKSNGGSEAGGETKDDGGGGFSAYIASSLEYFLI